MSGTRQATAIGLVFLALLAFFKSRLVVFLGLSALATMFHASAIVTVPLAALSFARNRLQSAVLILATAALAYYALAAGSRCTPHAMGKPHYCSHGDRLPYCDDRLRGACVLGVCFAERSVGASRAHPVAELFDCRPVSIPLFFLVPSTTSLDRLLLYVYSLQIFSLAMLPYTNLRVRPVLVILGIVAYFEITMWVFFNFAVNADAYIPYRAYGFNPSA